MITAMTAVITKSGLSLGQRSTTIGERLVGSCGEETWLWILSGMENSGSVGEVESGLTVHRVAHPYAKPLGRSGVHGVNRNRARLASPPVARYARLVRHSLIPVQSWNN